MFCPYYQEDQCLVANEIALLECYPSPRDCAQCGQCSNPRTVNEVTIRLATSTQEDAGLIVNKHKNANPLGIKLKLIIRSYGVTIDEDCDCETHIKQMNDWGEDCINHKEEIVSWLVNSPKYRYIPKWIKKLLARRLVNVATKQ